MADFFSQVPNTLKTRLWPTFVYIILYGPENQKKKYIIYSILYYIAIKREYKIYNLI